MQKYTSFQVHPTDEVRNMITMDHSILALTTTSLRSQMRRGIPCFTHTSDNMTDMHSLMFNGRTGRVVMGGLQEKLIDFDVSSGKEVSVKSDVSDGTCAILRDHSRFIVSGDAPAGRIHLRDPLTLSVAHTLEAHSGVLSDLDVHGHHLVTCGSHATTRAPDRFLMVYDLRILRAISPIQIHVVPYQLRFLPSMSSRIVVLSSVGQVQLVDTAALSTPQMSLFQVHSGMEGCSTVSMDISPSNQCLAFGDTSNQVHLFSSVPEPVFNPYARDTEFADHVETLPPMDINDELAIYASVPRPHLPPGQNAYVSDYWPDRFNKPAYRPTPDIDPEILRSMKIVGTVGYARNVANLKRNVVRYANVKQRGGGGDSGGTAGAASGHEHGDQGQGGQGHGHGHGNEKIHSMVPKHYRKVAIKLSKMGTDDFDFDRYNRTGFCGLEASLPNAYCNAMLQILYYGEKLRILLLNHTCSRENCVCCELSYLFHMMDISPGMPCQSSNFLRALRTIPEASALSLVFTDVNAVWRANVPRLVQSWNRFILQQVHMQSSLPKNIGLESGSRRPYWTAARSPMKTAKASSDAEDISAAFDQPRQQQQQQQTDSMGEDEKTENLFTSLLGMMQEKVNVCTRCKDVKTTHDTLLLCNMMYPESVASPGPAAAAAVSTGGGNGSNGKEDVIGKYSFADIVCSSMCPEQTTPAWCDQCRKYQTTNQTRNLQSLPHILSLNAGMDNSQDIAFWTAQMEYLYTEANPEEEPESRTQPAASATQTQKQLPPNVKPCRYALACTRPDCKFWHPEPESSTVPAHSVDIGTKCARLGISWIPLVMTIHRHANGKVSTGADVKPLPSTNENDSPDSLKVVETKTYELYGVCWAILDPTSAQPTNIVAAINVGPSYHARVASPVSQWYIFNDFSITTILPSEATAVHPSWKLPCVLFFQSRETSAEIAELEYKNPITPEVFLEDKSLAQRGGRKRITFIPLSSDEMPKKGDLVAIDAEFVTLNQEESELRSDGKVSTIKAAQMSVARITCVRGSGLLEGSPFIDDYISTQEQVVDYVTKFSGIKPGDLDANYSSKHLTTLKSTYKKLRYLVDLGVVFIGHGLKNDFKVINIVVPPEQVIDTVHLFHLPHHRMVSLKFLAWHFLDRKIQGVTHDSIEDAVTALSLYKKYLQLKEEDKLIEALNGLYEHGKECNWKTPEDD